jgi:PRTRC genetic system protein C
MSTTTHLTRRFKIGATLLNDPAPDLSPEDAVRLYVPNYPFIATAKLGEPVIEGDQLVYPVEKPTIQTKGAGDAVQAALDALEGWKNTPQSAPAVVEAWGTALFEIVKGTARRDPDPITDALLIPLA